MYYDPLRRMLQQVKRNGFSLVVPVYNEGSSLAGVLDRLVSALERLRARYDCELIVVDDGSTDETPRVLASAQRSRPGAFQTLAHDGNRGLTAALQTGCDFARYDTIVALDADLSYSPDIIEPLVAARLQSNAAAVLASPYMSGGHVANVPFDRLI